MGFLCLNKDDKKNVDQNLLKEENFLRDIGLDNVYNVQTNLNVCSETFLSPNFYVSGATSLFTLNTTNSGCTTDFTTSTVNYKKCPSGYTFSAGTSGNTCYSISGITTATTSAVTVVVTQTLATYNLDVTPDFNVTFNITGDTAYTAYTGNFCYKVFPKQYFNVDGINKVLNNGSESINNCVLFSDITGNTITQRFFSGNTPNTWNEYLIRPYYTFKSTKCNPGQNFNQWGSTTQLNQFNSETDFYFMTVVNPPKPELVGPSLQPLPNYNFIQDSLLTNGIPGPQGPQAINNELNYFVLKTTPVSQNIMLFLNGVKLTEGSDYNLIYYNGLLAPPVVEISIAPIKTTDWLVANYLVGQPNPLSGPLNQWFVNTIFVTGITIDINPGYVTAINYNSTTGNQEMYLTQPINPNNAIFLTINGVEMVENQQFFKSTSIDNMIIFDKTYSNLIITGDVVSVFTVSKDSIYGGNDYGQLETNEFTANWVVPTTIPENVTSTFKLQVTLKNDSGYTSVYYEKTLPFVTGVGNYNTNVTSIGLNNDYRFRVINEAVYNGYLNNKIKTCSSSEGFFSTTSGYINNTY